MRISDWSSDVCSSDLDLGSRVPRKMGLNWFMPALVKSSVGSSYGKTGDDGTKRCSARDTKKSTNVERMRSLGHSMGWQVSGGVRAQSGGVGGRALDRTDALTPPPQIRMNPLHASATRTTRDRDCTI